MSLIDRLASLMRPQPQASETSASFLYNRVKGQQIDASAQVNPDGTSTAFFQTPDITIEIQANPANLPQRVSASVRASWGKTLFEWNGSNKPQE